MDEIELLLDRLSQHKKVIFALYCCNDIKHLMNPEGHKCLELIEKWLNDNESVSTTELRDAAREAYNIYSAAASTKGQKHAHRLASTSSYVCEAPDYAASAAADAAYTADAVCASDLSASSATTAAIAAARAVNTESIFASKAREKTRKSKLAQYKTYLLKMIDELTPLEKEFS